MTVFHTSIAVLAVALMHTTTAAACVKPSSSSSSTYTMAPQTMTVLASRACEAGSVPLLRKTRIQFYEQSQSAGQLLYVTTSSSCDQTIMAPPTSYVSDDHWYTGLSSQNFYSWNTTGDEGEHWPKCLRECLIRAAARETNIFVAVLLLFL